MRSESFGELDDIGFLREVELFRGVAEPVIRAIALQAHTVRYRAGEMVVRRGDPGDRLFVVKSGVVEVIISQEPEGQRPQGPHGEGSAALAYLGRGECFGELALLTNSPRNADIRVPERAELLVIDKSLFDDLMSNHHGFGSQLAVILAHRLAGLLEKLPDRRSKKELSGSLHYFDLATVIQTLISSGQSGPMRLSSATEPVAELYFAKGNILRARYGERTGDEAVHHLFQVQPQGEFLFSSQTSETPVTDADPNITIPAMALMMDSIRLQDELSVLEERLPVRRALVERAGSDLSWPDPKGRSEAESLWHRLGQPLSVAELLEGSHSCRYHAADALLALLESEQVMPALHGHGRAESLPKTRPSQERD